MISESTAATPDDARAKPVRLFYVDDSGAERSGYATFSWIEFIIDDWNAGLMLDRRLQVDGELGLLVMDGDGTDSSYYAAHRDLDLGTRALIEDPAFQNSHRSQWVQIADLIAYAGYQHLVRLPEKQFAWEWYRTLGERVLGTFEV